MVRHLEECESCRIEVERVEAAIEACRGADSGGELAQLLEDRVMAAIRLMPSPQRDFSVRDWLIAGSVIAASMLLIPVGDYFVRFKEIFGASYTLPLSLVLGIALTAYSALFIGTHMDEVQGFMNKHVRQH
jgi:hypothetical protein